MSHLLRKQFVLLLLIMFLTGCGFVDRLFGPDRPNLEMTYVEGGTYRMGDVFAWGNDDAQPVHKVTVSDFRIGTYEVTYQQYDVFAEAEGFPKPKDDGFGRGKRAVAYVNWDEAQAFCEWYGYRLPTEREWEYAARSRGKRIRFPGTNNKDSLRYYARMEEFSSPQSYFVGTKKPNELGLYDMAGNVYEWIGAYYPIFERFLENGEWYDLEKHDMRVIRGGSFSSDERTMYNFWRVGTVREERVNDLGFRCVVEL
jgi:sulfatase modifying factor 1